MNLAPPITAIDTATRANENPLSNGGKWTAASFGSSALKLVSNQIVRQGASGVFGSDGSYRNDITFPANAQCGVCGKIANTGSDGSARFWLWNPGAGTGYQIEADVGTFGTGVLIGRSDGAVIATNSSFSVATSDVYMIVIQGNDVVGFRINGNVLTEVLRATDTTYRVAFNPGLEIAGLNDVSSLGVTFFGYVAPPSLAPQQITQAVCRSSVY